jgi:ribulose-phosphate 3-epimerase
MRKNIKIAPSILSADFSCLGEQVRQVEEAGADLIHIDIMDGRFVPNITAGPIIVEAVRKITHLPLDVHLMIVEPEKYIKKFIDSGADYLSVHYEASIHLNRSINKIKDLGVKAGAVINPSTALCNIEEVLPLVDYILIMSVNPGFGGQKFISETLEKIKKCRKMIDEAKLNCLIEIDGGVNAENISSIVKAGAEMIVAGYSIFGKKNIKEAFQELKEEL